MCRDDDFEKKWIGMRDNKTTRQIDLCGFSTQATTIKIIITNDLCHRVVTTGGKVVKKFRPSNEKWQQHSGTRLPLRRARNVITRDIAMLVRVVGGKRCKNAAAQKQTNGPQKKKNAKTRATDRWNGQPPPPHGTFEKYNTPRRWRGDGGRRVDGARLIGRRKIVFIDAPAKKWNKKSS
ncbi:Uncharacterized protein FWK35_00004453 [Aphis craccivora]|uniref:Uncharacterized protein n=1 Tax=Aphis craccivora TaxID=307492 RepID=A0A6G0ZG73_APHCR|nr:Uncharacterized protein FWK35_00004453 [Aphis craccivora]